MVQAHDFPSLSSESSSGDNRSAHWSSSTVNNPAPNSRNCCHDHHRVSHQLLETFKNRKRSAVEPRRNAERELKPQTIPDRVCTDHGNDNRSCCLGCCRSGSCRHRLGCLCSYVCRDNSVCGGSEAG